MDRQAILIMGKQTSGKGTQANFLADRLDLIHLDTGKHIESTVHDPKNQDDPVIREQREIFDSGKLNTPEWVLEEIVKGGTRKIHEAGFGVVFSGSPRSMFEVEGLLPLLIELYGKENIHVFILEISDETALRRTLSRLLCSECGSPLLAEYYPQVEGGPKLCPRCGGNLYRRTLDNKEALKNRLEWHNKETLPVLGFLKNQGISIVTINGEQEPFKVFRDINAHLTQK